jgi:RNA polymerase subunit RPABC4/transcription elongation factor Spt4
MVQMSDSDECPICKAHNYTPNAKTMKAMNEVGRKVSWEEYEAMLDDAEECPICKAYNYTPNAETMEAMKAVEAGIGIVHIGSTENLKAYLDAT